MSSHASSYRIASLSLFALVLFVSSSSGQQSPNPPPGPPDPAASNPAGAAQDTQSLDNAVKPAVYAPTEQEIRAIGSSVSLPRYDTLLRWGPIYVRSIELFQSYDQIGNVTSGAQGIFNQDSFNATVLKTDIVYDRPTRLGRFVVEYAPRLTVINGRTNADFLNQTLGANWVEQLSSRWTLGLSDTFTYFSVRNLYGDYFLDVNAVAGASVPSSFLESAASWLNAGTQASLSYALSPTSSLTVSPGFAYSHTTGLINGAEPTDAYQYSGTLAWTKRLSPNASISADYGYRLVQGLGGHVPYNNGDFGFSWQLGSTTTIGATAGVLTEGFATSTGWTVSGSAQLAEKWGRSTISIGYYRGVPLFKELGSQGVSQVSQATYRFNLTPRWYWSAQGGYEDSLTKSVADLSAKFASTEVGFQISSQVNCFASYGYKTQAAFGAPALLSGNVNTVIGGIRWTARPAQ